MTAARMRVVVLAAALCGAGVVALVLTSDRARRRPRMGGVRADRHLELRGHRPVRLAPTAREPHRRAARGARVRMVPRGAGVRERGAPLHLRARRGRALGRGVPAPRHELPDGPRRAGSGPGDRRGGLRALHGGLHAGAPVRRSGGARLRGLRGRTCCRSATTSPWRTRCSPCRRALRRPVRRRPHRPDAALAPGGSASTACSCTPVYACALLAFVLVTAGNAGAGEVFPWAAFVATALLPFAFLAGLLRTHVARLDAELMTRLDELRSSRARLVEAGDAERRRLERDLHDGAQSRLVSVTMLLGRVRLLVDDDERAKALLDRAQSELRIGLAELRELARGIHPAVLTERGLEPAISALATRAPVPVTVDAEPRASPRAGGDRRLLRRLRGADERRQVRAGDRGDGGPCAAATGRWRSRSPTTGWAAPTPPAARASRARRPGRRARRDAVRRQPRGWRDACARRDPVRGRRGPCVVRRQGRRRRWRASSPGAWTGRRRRARRPGRP